MVPLAESRAPAADPLPVAGVVYETPVVGGRGLAWWGRPCGEMDVIWKVEGLDMAEWRVLRCGRVSC